jgi:rhamnose utilization protein RhaD (predicted bifunctional aldolase and dehydrogenase)
VASNGVVIRADTAEEFRDELVSLIRDAAKLMRQSSVNAPHFKDRMRQSIVADTMAEQANIIAAIKIERKS